MIKIKQNDDAVDDVNMTTMMVVVVLVITRPICCILVKSESNVFSDIDHVDGVKMMMMR